MPLPIDTRPGLSASIPSEVNDGGSQNSLLDPQKSMASTTFYSKDLLVVQGRYLRKRALDHEKAEMKAKTHIIHNAIMTCQEKYGDKLHRLPGLPPSPSRRGLADKGDHTRRASSHQTCGGRRNGQANALGPHLIGKGETLWSDCRYDGGQDCRPVR